MTSQNKDYNCHVGIDVSKATLDVFVSATNESFQVENNKKGYQILIKNIKHHTPLVALEATGGYERNIVRALQSKQMDVSIVNPRNVRNFAKAASFSAKTDKIDSKVIALFAEKLKPKVSAVREEKQQKLIDLKTRRHQVVCLISQERNRLEMASDSIKKNIKKLVSFLQEELKAIEKIIDKLISEDEALVQKREIMQSMCGIGKTISMTLLSDLPELGTKSAKEISALVGLAPYNRDSGNMRGQRCIWGGRAHVRTALYMGTLVAIKHNPIIKRFYNHLVDGGKKKMVAITACMHKILIILNAMVKNQRLWGIDIQPIG